MEKLELNDSVLPTIRRKKKPRFTKDRNTKLCVQKLSCWGKKADNMTVKCFFLVILCYYCFQLMPDVK